MQLVAGTDLGALLRREGPLPPERAVAIVAQVAVGPAVRAPAAPPPARRWLRPALVAAVAVLLGAGLAAPVVLNGRDRPAAAVPAAAGRTTPARAATTPKPTKPTKPARPAAAAPLDARHQALLDAVADDGGVVRSTCVPLPSNERGLVNTAITCSTADPTLGVPIGFYRLNSPVAYTARVTGLRKQVKQPGQCADGRDAAVDWTLAGSPRGYVSCLSSAAGRGFVIRWGAKGSLIEARVQDRSAAKAYDWWTRHAAIVPAGA